MAQKVKFKLHSQDIKDFLEKKDYIHALSLSKKLISDFPNEKGALKILTQSQSLYDKEKLKKEKAVAKDDKIKILLQEI